MYVFCLNYTQVSILLVIAYTKYFANLIIFKETTAHLRYILISKL